MDVSIAQRVLIRIGQLARRSDVVVVRRWLGRSAPPKPWKEELPEDAFDFFTDLNGIVFEWRFVDETETHGLTLMELGKNGSVVDWLNGATMAGSFDVSRWKERWPGVAAWSSGSLVFIEGSEDDGLYVHRQGAELGLACIDNDGNADTLTASFSELLGAGLESGFAHMWRATCTRKGTHPSVSKVAERLARDVPARRGPYTLTFSALEKIDAAAYRRWIGAGLASKPFATIVKAAKRSEKFNDLTVDERARVIEECTASPNFSAAAMNDVLRQLWHVSGNRKDFLERFRCGGGPVIRARFDVRWESDRAGEPGHVGDDDEIARMLLDTEGVRFVSGLPSDDLLRYDCARIGRHASFQPFVDSRVVQDWKGRKAKEATVELIVEPGRLEGVTLGVPLRSSAIPNQLSELGSLRSAV